MGKPTYKTISVDSVSNSMKQISSRQQQQQRQQQQRRKPVVRNDVSEGDCRKKTKKTVRWKPDDELVQVRYFEWDPTERTHFCFQGVSTRQNPVVTPTLSSLSSVRSLRRRIRRHRRRYRGDLQRRRLFDQQNAPESVRCSDAGCGTANLNASNAFEFTRVSNVLLEGSSNEEQVDS